MNPLALALLAGGGAYAIARAASASPAPPADTAAPSEPIPAAPVETASAAPAVESVATAPEPVKAPCGCGGKAVIETPEVADVTADPEPISEINWSEAVY